MHSNSIGQVFRHSKWKSMFQTFVGEIFEKREPGEICVGSSRSCFASKAFNKTTDTLLRTNFENVKSFFKKK